MAKSEPSLAAQAHALAGTQGPRSAVERVRDQLEPKLRAEFVAAVNDLSVPASGLSKAMRTRGYEVSPGSINHWRQSGRVLV